MSVPKFQVGDIVYIVDYDYDDHEYKVYQEIIACVICHDYSPCFDNKGRITFYYSTQSLTQRTHEHFYIFKEQAQLLLEAYTANQKLLEEISKLKKENRSDK